MYDSRVQIKWGFLTTIAGADDADAGVEEPQTRGVLKVGRNSRRGGVNRRGVNTVRRP